MYTMLSKKDKNTRIMSYVSFVVLILMVTVVMVEFWKLIINVNTDQITSLLSQLNRIQCLKLVHLIHSKSVSIPLLSEILNHVTSHQKS